jgi:hypothetical protein
VNDEDLFFMTFVQDSLYPKGDNASKDEGPERLTILLPCFMVHRNKKTIDQHAMFIGCASLALDTVRCAPDSLVHHKLVQVWLPLAKLLQLNFSRFEKFPST